MYYYHTRCFHICLLQPDSGMFLIYININTGRYILLLETVWHTRKYHHIITGVDGLLRTYCDEMVE